MLRKTARPNKKLGILQRFGLFFYRKKEVTFVYWAAVVLFGIVSYTTLLPRQGFPNVDVPISVVSGSYFVNNKEKVDTELAQKASEVVQKINGVTEVNVSSSENFFVMTVGYDSTFTSESGSARVAKELSGANLPKEASLEFMALDASRYEEKSDLLLSVFSKDGSTAGVTEKATQMASLLSKNAAVKSASVITQSETGTNPTTGQEVTLQKSFDITGTKDGIGQIHIKNSVIIGVRANEGVDAFGIYDAVQATIADAKSNEAFSSVEFLIVADFAEDITSQIDNLQQSLLEGLVVVILVSFLLISWRAGLATALSMVTVLLATVGFLYAVGITLNTITLFALILSLGLIVDDTTIMVEAIDAAKKKGSKQTEIVASAIKKVARASFAGTLTTMLGFAPMLFISGVLGDFIRILPITIIVALAMSLLISLSLVPFFAHFLLAGKQKETFIGRIESKMSGTLASIVLKTRGSKKRRFTITALALFISFAGLLGSVVYFSKLKFDIFPSTKDSNVISVSIATESGATVESSKQIVQDVVKKVSDTAGSNFRRLSLQNSGSRSGATITLDLISYKNREVTAPQLITSLEEVLKNTPNAEVRVSQVDAGPPKDAYPFSVRLFGEDTEKTIKLGQSIETFLNGKTVTRANGTTSTIQKTRFVTDSVTRKDSKRYVEVAASFTDTDVSALTVAAQKAVEKEFTESALAQYGVAKQDLVFDFGNESSNQDAFSSMLLAFPVLLFIMYALLAFQFKSFLQPLLIFAAIPYSFFGVAVGLYYTNNPLSFFVMIGFFALIGIAVNNTILLTDFANQARAEGKGPTEAIASALTSRFRPLITTSLTSVVALVPLAISDPFWESLAYTLIFGLLSSTFFVVVSFPYAYLLAEWLRAKTKRKR